MLFKKEFNQEEVDTIAREFEEEAAKKVLDPQGMYKPKTVHKQELTAFIRAWQDQTGKKLTQEELTVLLQELEGISQKRIWRRWRSTTQKR